MKSGMEEVAKEFKKSSFPIIGTCACCPFPNESNWKSLSLCWARNFLFRIGLMKGFNGVLFLSKGFFQELEGYDEKMGSFEHIDLIKRAVGQGAKWVFIKDAYVFVSMRRYERDGYLKILLWWGVEALRYKFGLRSKWMSFTE